MKYKQLSRILLIITFVLFPLTAFAENIDPDSDGSQYAWGENVGWINFEPSHGPGVTVTDSAVTGYAWGENIGWINLSPANGGVFNDGLGNLSGYTWGENIGWINFAPTGGGVTINPVTGVFSGYAWGENIGWINFAPNGKPVKTSWTGGIPNISVSPASHDFGYVLVGCPPATQTFTVSNTGTANLVIGTLTLAGPSPLEFHIQDDYCSGQTLAPSGSCTVQVRFLPTVMTLSNATLSIPSNDPDPGENPLDVPLTGTGIAPDFPVFPTGHNFGNVVVSSSSAAQTFTFSNAGCTNLSIYTITITGTDANQFGKLNDHCSGQTLAPSSSCTVQAVFSPTSAGGKSANLSIPSNAPGSPALVPLSGTGTLPAVTCSFTAYGTKLSRGSNLKFLAAFQNDTDQVQVFQFATFVTLPNLHRYPSSGWLLGPITITLDPHTSMSKLLTQFIPYNAPFGNYTYHGYVGKTGVGLYNQCQFDFIVNP